MICQYTSNYKDFKAGQILARRHKRRLALTFYFWFAVLPALGIGALILLIVGNTGHRLAIVDHFGAGLAGFSAGSLWLLVCRPFYMRKAYKRAKAGRPDDSPVELELTENELISRIPGNSEGRFFPAAVNDYAEDEQIVLIWLTAKHFLYIPKRALTEEQWTVLRTWIYEKTGVKR